MLLQHYLQMDSVRREMSEKPVKLGDLLLQLFLQRYARVARQQVFGNDVPGNFHDFLT
jgi:hypothetical protein